MDNKACLKLLVLFLGFSFVLSSTAVPATSETHASIFFFFFLFIRLFIYFTNLLSTFYVLAGMAKSDNENPVQVQELLAQVPFSFFSLSELHYNQSSDI